MILITHPKSGFFNAKTSNELASGCYIKPIFQTYVAEGLSCDTDFFFIKALPVTYFTFHRLVKFREPSQFDRPASCSQPIYIGSRF